MPTRTTLSVCRPSTVATGTRVSEPMTMPSGAPYDQRERARGGGRTDREGDPSPLMRPSINAKRGGDTPIGLGRSSRWRDDRGHGSRTIVHATRCVLRAVEQRDRPEWRGAGHRWRRPEARCRLGGQLRSPRFGVHSAMSLPEAARRCPNGVFLPVDGRRYQQASRDVMAILRRFTPQCEPISIDEAFLDVTGSPTCSGTVRRSPRGSRRPSAPTSGDRSVGVRRTSSSPRSLPTYGSPTASSSSRPAKRRHSSRHCRSGGCGGSARRPRSSGGLRGPHDRRSRGPARRRHGEPFGKHGASLAERARGSPIRTRSTTVTRRSPSGMSTPSKGTRPTRR